MGISCFPAGISYFPVVSGVLGTARPRDQLAPSAWDGILSPRVNFCWGDEAAPGGTRCRTPDIYSPFSLASGFIQSCAAVGRKEHSHCFREKAPNPSTLPQDLCLQTPKEEQQQIPVRSLGGLGAGLSQNSFQGMLCSSPALPLLPAAQPELGKREKGSGGHQVIPHGPVSAGFGVRAGPKKS